MLLFHQKNVIISYQPFRFFFLQSLFSIINFSLSFLLYLSFHHALRCLPAAGRESSNIIFKFSFLCGRYLSAKDLHIIYLVLSCFGGKMFLAIY